MIPPRTSHPESGLTLVEVLVASLILALGLSAVMAVIPEAYRNTLDSGRTSVLSHLAAEKIEDLRSRGLSDAQLSVGVHPAQQTDTGGARYYPVPGFDEQYSLRWIVSAGPTDGAGNAEPNMRTVVVEATFLTRYTNTGDPLRSAGSLQITSTTFLTD